jgi:hypothetical protein
VPAKKADQLKAVHAGEHHVEKDQIRESGSGDAESRITGFRPRDIEAFEPEVIREDLSKRPVVLDNENSLASCHPVIVPIPIQIEAAITRAVLAARLAPG